MLRNPLHIMRMSLIVALDVKVGEIYGDAPLWRSQDLPDAVLFENG